MATCFSIKKAIFVSPSHTYLDNAFKPALLIGKDEWALSLLLLWLNHSAKFHKGSRPIISIYLFLSDMKMTLAANSVKKTPMSTSMW